MTVAAANPTVDAQPRGLDAEIPDKLYFKIGEVVDLVGVQAHVLRYWEKEIPSIRPTKTTSNQRRYRRKDVETFREVRRLLHNERYTLAGARRRLAEINRLEAPVEPSDASPVCPRPSQPPVQPLAVEPVSTSLTARAGSVAQLEAVRAGLRELIRMTGEDP